MLFAALALAPAAAHLLELPNKIGLSRDEYLIAQQLYRGWAFLGVVVFAALGSALAHAIAVRTQQATANWTVLPENWTALRAQWEYSHAASALLNLAALAALIAAVLVREK